MATTRNAPPSDPPASPEGITPEQRSALDAYVNELSQLGGTPPAPPPEAPPRVSEDQWAAMSDRQREAWVSSEVGWNLEQLARLDADRRRDAEIEALKNKANEPEGPPQDLPPLTLLQRFQKFMWGDQQDKS